MPLYSLLLSYNLYFWQLLKVQLQILIFCLKVGELNIFNSSCHVVSIPHCNFIHGCQAKTLGCVVLWGAVHSRVHFLCCVCCSSRGCSKIFRHICKTVKWLLGLKDSLPCYKSILIYCSSLYFITNVFTAELIPLTYEEGMAKWVRLYHLNLSQSLHIALSIIGRKKAK